jgi:nitric oxide reductase NorE protein
VNTRVDTGRLPGEPGIWVLVIGDLTIFALFFCTYAFHRGLEPALFRDSQLGLTLHLGVVNTLLLLTSSWLVVLAVQAVRDGHADHARGLLAGGFACGAGFVVVKYFEYGGVLRMGASPASNDFYMFYFVLTGIHLVHLLVGLGVLAWMRTRSRRPVDARGAALLECGAVYWHMVDLLWVVLFALFYLMH